MSNLKTIIPIAAIGIGTIHLINKYKGIPFLSSFNCPWISAKNKVTSSDNNITDTSTNPVNTANSNTSSDNSNEINTNNTDITSQNKDETSSNGTIEKAF